MFLIRSCSTRSLSRLADSGVSSTISIINDGVPRAAWIEEGVMKLLLYSFVVGLLICSLSFAQATLTQSAVTNTTLQSGYAVITPLTGTGEGLSVTEIFGQQAGAIFSQASVVASPLVTLTDVVVNVNTAAGLNTGIAIVNPNNSPSVLTFTLRNSQGGTVATRSITIGGHQQVSRFVTELFAGEPAL